MAQAKAVQEVREVTEKGVEIPNKIAGKQEDGSIATQVVTSVQKEVEKVKVLCLEEGFYRYGQEFISLYKNKHIMLTPDQAEYYRNLNKVR